MDGRCGKDAERWKPPLKLHAYPAGNCFLHVELKAGAAPHKFRYDISPDGRTIKPGYWIIPADFVTGGDDPVEDAARYGKATRAEAERKIS